MISGLPGLPLDQDYKAESITFTMNGDVDVAAQYHRSAFAEDGSDVVGPIIVGTAVVAGGALSTRWAPILWMLGVCVYSMVSTASGRS